jgi:hypothetical protein
MSDNDDKPNAIYINVPPRLLILSSAALVVGFALGITRGSRRASMQFLAENAHNPPTTVRGWYHYKKEKNYKVMLGGLKEAGREGAKLGAAALGWVGIEEGLTRLGQPFDSAKTTGAAIGTGAVYSLVSEWFLLY